MFKSIQFRLVFLFVLIIFCVMMTVGTFIIGNVTSFYYSSFMTQMAMVFDDSFLDEIRDVMRGENQITKLKELLDASSGRIGIDSYRHYAILSGGDGTYVSGSDELILNSVEISDNILTALTGYTGDAVYENSKYIDYAYPITENDNVLNIIYIYETKSKLNDFSNNMFNTVFQAMLIGIAISVVLGYLLSKTITTPIKNLTARAENLTDTSVFLLKPMGRHAANEETAGKVLGEIEERRSRGAKDEIGILTDTFQSMSERLRETVFELANQNNKLEKIMEYSTDGIVAFDTNGNLLLINAPARKYLSIASEKEKNIDFDGFFNPVFSDITLGDFLYLKKDTQVIKEAEYGDYYLRFHFGSFMYSNDKTGGIIVDVQDMTQEQKLELARREFVANVSHELRTPLTTIKAYIETMLGDSVDEETRGVFLNTVNREADRMTRLVSDLLTLSRLDNGAINLKLRQMKIEAVLRAVCDIMQFEAKSKNQNLTYNVINEIPAFQLDRDKIEKVIINIVSNAIKYTPSGGNIEIYSRFIPGKAVVRVKDNGIGIPEKDLDRIYERFYRVDKARSREQGGTGLGLAIAKEIITAHKGEINIASVLNEGTEISIFFPID